MKAKAEQDLKQSGIFIKKIKQDFLACWKSILLLRVRHEIITSC